MKKILALLFAVVMLVSAAAVPAAPKPEATGSAVPCIYTVLPAYSRVGNEVTVSCRIRGNYEADIISIRINVDKAHLEFVSCAKGEVAPETPEPQMGMTVQGDQFSFAIIMPSGSISMEGELFTATFRIKEGVSEYLSFPLVMSMFCYNPIGGQPVQLGYEFSDAVMPVLAESAPVPVGTPVVTGKNVYDTGLNKLVWDEVEGADEYGAGYEVWRSDAEDGAYELVCETSGLTYLDEGAMPGDTYYYKVRAVTTTGEYGEFSEAVRRVCDLPRPVVTSSHVASSGKNKLTWEKVDGAVSYKVYRATVKDGPYSLMKTTADTSYINTNAEAGVTYYYKVRAVHENSEATSAYSLIKTVTCDLPQPVVTGTHVPSTGKNKLTWEKVDGAKEYEVYRSSEKNGDYSRVFTTSNLSYTNTKCSPGETYYYYVIAVHEKSAANSAKSAIKTLTCDLPQPVVTISLTSAGKPKLAWEAIEGAKEYKVYRSTESGSGFSLVFTTSNTTYTNTGAASGTTYYYKVMAIHEKSAANSAYSEVVSITTK